MDPAQSREWNWEWRRGTSPAIYDGPWSLSLFPSIHHVATLMDNPTPVKVTTLDEIEAAAAGTPSDIPTKIADAPGQSYAPPAIPIPTAPPPLTTGAPEPTPSSTRLMTRQTAASFKATKARSSTEELIDSLNDLPEPVSSPQGPSHRKQKGKETEASSPAAVTYLKTAPASASAKKKAEDTAAGIKRLDGNVSAVAHRVDEVYHEFSDEVSSLRAQILGLASDISASQRAPDDRLDDVVRSTNQIARAVAELRADNRGINSAIQADHGRLQNLSTSIEELKSQMARLVNIAGRLERHGTGPDPTSTVVAQSGYPFTFRPPPPAPSFPGPALAPNLPSAPPPRGSRYSDSADASVIVGPMAWGKDITGQAKALLGMLPSMQRSSQHGLRARRCQHSSHHITIAFPNPTDAAVFINAWQKEAPLAYEGVSAVLDQGN